MLCLLQSQLVLLDVPLEVIIYFGHRVAPSVGKAQNHVVDVFVEGIIHVVVKILLRDKLENFLVVLPVLQFSLLYVVFGYVRFILDELHASLYHVEDH